jgi:hypothetical protein
MVRTNTPEDARRYGVQRHQTIQPGDARETGMVTHDKPDFFVCQSNEREILSK